MLSNTSKFANKFVNLAKASPEQIITQDLYSLRGANVASLTNMSRRNKISWQYGSPYNKRWQYKWKHAYYTYPKEGVEHDQVKKPEDSPDSAGYMFSLVKDI